MIDLFELYKTDKNFKEYTDKYARTHRMLAEDAIKTMVVKEYAKYLRGGDRC